MQQDRQKDKENTIRNSKLQMSIKPFTISREDLGKSKSVDKTRKGISRVHVQPTPPIQTPLSHNLYASQPTLPKPQAQIQPQLQPQLHPQLEPPIKPQPRPRYEGRRNIEFDLQCKVELLQKQLVVIEKENIEILQEHNEWKTKCNNLFQLNQNLQQVLKQTQQKLNNTHRNLLAKQQLFQKRQKYIEELLQINNKDKQKLQQCNQHIHHLSLQLEENSNKIIELQGRGKGNYGGGGGFEQELRQALRNYKQAKDLKVEAEENYRQMLIKSSSLESQKQILQANIRSLSYQLQSQHQTNTKILHNYQLLQHQFSQLQKQAIFARACRKQLEQLTLLRQTNIELKTRIIDSEHKIKQLEQRRLNQIEFHQDEIRRISTSQNGKYEGLIQLYKKERDQAMEKVREMETAKWKWQNVSKKQKQNVIDIENASRDYEILVTKLEGKLREVMENGAHRDREFDRIVREKDGQISELMSKLNQIKQDNKFLLIRAEQKANQEILDRSRQRKTESQLPTDHETLRTLQTQLCQLQTQNKQITHKLSHYQLQQQKLSDQLHLLKIAEQKHKSQEDTLQRKIKHLLEEVEHLQHAKNKGIQEKVQLVAEMQGLRLTGKNREIDFGRLEEKLREITGRLQEASKQCKEYKMEIDNLNNRLQQASEESISIHSVKQNYQKQISQIKETHRLQITRLSQQIQTTQKQRDSYKKCYQLAQEEIEITKEKLTVRQYLTQKQEVQEKEERLGLYRQFFAIIGVQSDIGLLAENEILGILAKQIRLTTQKKLQTELKCTKIDTQYRQLLQAEAATRLLAQKYQQKCHELETLLIRMQDAHQDKLSLVKQDYDVVYGKYLKYRNMVIAGQGGKGKERDRSKDKGIIRG